MATGGVLGNGTKVGYALTSPITWVAIGQILDVVFPTWEGDKVDITTHSVTNTLHRNMAGLISVGDPSFEVLSDFDPATSAWFAAMMTANASGVSVYWRFEVPVNRERTSFRGCEFSASVLSFVPTTPIDDKQATRFTLSFDGTSITWDAVVGASEIT